MSATIIPIDKGMVRLNHDVDPMVGPTVTAAELKETIAKVSAEYGPLYRRSWQKRTSPARAGAPAGGPVITILQYNLLAEGLSSSPTSTPPFEAQMPETRFYGGFDNVPNPEKVFDFSKRRFRLLEDILRYDPTILTLEECDHFPDFFEPALRKFGYEGVFQPKFDAPGCFNGHYSDGVCVMWKAGQYRLDGSDAAWHAPSSSFGVAGAAVTGPNIDTGPDGVSGDPETGQDGGTRLKVVHVIVPLLPIAPTAPAAPKQRLIVVATHLKAKGPNEATRVKQIKALLGLVQTVRNDGDAVIVAGDFNADPFPATHDGSETFEPKAINATLQSGLALSSAYVLPTCPADPAYTTWKSRAGKETRHVIDYIFHSSQLQCTEVLAPPAAAELEPTRLPGMRGPSDHLPIAAKLVILQPRRSPCC